jgi:cobalt-zinc-cadmium efflux system outer membrane protein
MRIRLWIVATIVAARTLTAQSTAPPTLQPLTLAEARARARQASPELVAAREAIAAAAGKERQAGAWPNPTLGFSREQTSRAGEENSQNVVSLEQRLEISGARGARKETARFERNAAEARLAAAAARVDYDVARAYAAAVASQRRATLADEASASFGTARRVSQARLAGGDVSGYQHRRLLLEATRYATLRSEALVARDSALRALHLLLGDSVLVGDSSRTSAVAVFLTDTLLPAQLALSVDSLAERSLRTRPELLAARLDARAAAASVGVARAERIPTPLVSGGYKGERLATGETLNGFVAGVSIPLPLWDRRGGAVAAAEAEAKRLGATFVGAERQARLEIADAYASHQALAAQLVDLQARLGQDAAVARRAAQAAYAEGEISLLEWLDSVRAYQEAESSYVTLWSEYVTRRAALERLTGLSLF